VPLFVLAGCSNSDVSKAATQAVSASSNYSIDTKQTNAEGHVDIYVLDIGQGDAILLKVGDEYSMIDTGDIEHREPNYITSVLLSLKMSSSHILMQIIWVVF